MTQSLLSLIVALLLAVQSPNVPESLRLQAIQLANQILTASLVLESTTPAVPSNVGNPSPLVPAVAPEPVFGGTVSSEPAIDPCLRTMTIAATSSALNPGSTDFWFDVTAPCSDVIQVPFTMTTPFHQYDNSGIGSWEESADKHSAHFRRPFYGNAGLTISAQYGEIVETALSL